MTNPIEQPRAEFAGAFEDDPACTCPALVCPLHPWIPVQPKAETPAPRWGMWEPDPYDRGAFVRYRPAADGGREANYLDLGRLNALEADLAAAQKRIAELEARLVIEARRNMDNGTRRQAAEAERDRYRAALERVGGEACSIHACGVIAAAALHDAPSAAQEGALPPQTGEAVP